MNHYVYRIDRPSNGEYYIGMRQCEGPPVLDTKYMGSGKKLKPQVRAHPEEFTKTILLIVNTREMATRIEAALVPIERIDNDPLCLNLCAGGDVGPAGLRHSEKSRAKMSAAHLGVKLSEEHRAKIGAAHLGRKMSEEHRAKIGAANMGHTRNLGQKRSEEARARMIAAQQRRRQREKV